MADTATSNGMFSTNKWVNLLIFLALTIVVSLIVVHSVKVVDTAGKDTGNRLKAFGGSDTPATTTK